MTTWRTLTPPLDLWPLLFGLTSWAAFVGALGGILGFFIAGFWLS